MNNTETSLSTERLILQKIEPKDIEKESCLFEQTIDESVKTLRMTNNEKLFRADKFSSLSLITESDVIIASKIIIRKNEKVLGYIIMSKTTIIGEVTLDYIMDKNCFDGISELEAIEIMVKYAYSLSNVTNVFIHHYDRAGYTTALPLVAGFSHYSMTERYGNNIPCFDTVISCRWKSNICKFSE